MPPASGGAAAAPAAGGVPARGSRSSPAPRAPPWTSRLAASGPAARGGRAARAGLPLRCGHAIGDRLGDGRRRRCGRGRRSLPSLSRAGPRSRDRLPGGEARSSQCRGVVGGDVPTGWFGRGGCRDVVVAHPYSLRTVARESRLGQEDSGSRCEPDVGSVVPVPPGLGACGPCPGPRARSRTRNVLVRRLRSLGPRLAAGVPRGRPDEVRAPCRSLASAVPGEQV